MNSLEFIDEEIKYCKKELEENKQNCLVSKVGKTLIIGRHLYLRKKLRALYQIKDELEAWYVVKKHTIITDGGVIHMAVEDDEIGYEKLEKALEVKENVG